MTIDIKKGTDGKWYVVAHLQSGDAHDAFDTQAEAVEFAQAFYGGKLAPVAQPARELEQVCNALFAPYTKKRRPSRARVQAAIQQVFESQQGA